MIGAMTALSGTLGWLAAPLMLTASLTQAPDTQPALWAFLRNRLDFSEAELAAVERGDVVTKVPGRGDKREAAVFGIVRVRASIPLFIERHRDVASFMKTKWVTQIGTFAAPPQQEDLERLIFTQKHIDAIRDCRMGDCDLKLPAAAIERFQREVDWSAPDAPLRAAQLYRRWLLEYVTAYLSGGNTALIRYADKSEPQDIAAGFRQLVDESPYLLEYVPQFHHYLDRFPEAALPGVENRLYWSVEDFGYRPVITITHLTLHHRQQAGGPQVLVALKQIYASHYFQAAVKFMAVVEASEPTGTPTFYLLYLDRSLFDTRLGGIKGRMVRSRLEDNTRERLNSVRRGLERAE